MMMTPIHDDDDEDDDDDDDDAALAPADGLVPPLPGMALAMVKGCLICATD